MNTRLQVEHPVTESVTGLDLVELMIRIAAGERLPFGQDEVRLKGWAIEARVYAEDPFRNFLPSIGRLVRYRAPEGDGVRVDTGVFEGADISLYYDPMIAKLIASGPDRAVATERLRRALDGFYVAGVRSNIAFLGAIIGSKRFAKGTLSTDFIAEEFPDGFAPPPEESEADRVILVAAALARQGVDEIERAAHETERRLTILLDGRPHTVTVRREAGASAVETEAGSCTARTDWLPGEPLLHLHIDGRSETVQIEPLSAVSFRLVHGGVIREAQILPPRAAELLLKMPKKQPADTSRLVVSPMPGLLTAVAVDEGQEVKAGEPLVTVEAMKMENVLRAERDGKVAKLRARPGDNLAVDQVILEFE
jgi:propionyl-CoA carboxylase alpha chain